jgi:aminoglycoside 3-N-acetyltransferase
MRERVYYMLRNRLSQESRTKLKKRLAYERRRVAPVLRTLHGEFGADDLIGELDRHVDRDCEIVMVHCSMNDLQPTYTGSAKDLLDALMDWVLPDRTLAMPAFFAVASGDPSSYFRRRPRFDVRREPSEMGLLSELFRRRAGVVRSLHPAASVCAIGPLADDLVASHHESPTNFGPGTPFAVMAARRTAIVGIGAEYFRSLTQVHAAEDLLGDRYPLALRPATVPVTMTAADDTTYEYQLPVSSEPLTDRLRLQMLERLLTRDELRRWRFHGVPLFVTTAARVTDALVEAAERGETLYQELPIKPRRGARARTMLRAPSRGGMAGRSG